MSCPGCETIAQPVELRLTPATAAVTAEQPRDSGLRDADRFEAHRQPIAQADRQGIAAGEDRGMGSVVSGAGPTGCGDLHRLRHDPPAALPADSRTAVVVEDANGAHWIDTFTSANSQTRKLRPRSWAAQFASSPAY